MNGNKRKEAPYLPGRMTKSRKAIYYARAALAAVTMSATDVGL